MRLDKLTIGSLKDSPSHQFKNLKNVTIDFAQRTLGDSSNWLEWHCKSNVLEALAIIFRDLIAKKTSRICLSTFPAAWEAGNDKQKNTH